MRALCIHAHCDDFEFCAAGLFTRWKQTLGEAFTGKVILCTDGAAGHHQMTRAETSARRWQEQAASAKLGGYACEPLRLRDGSIPREGCLDTNPETLAALWKAIRTFRPDYLICPPIAGDPLAGIHIDHVAVADLVRKVAYLINVPHAFTPEYPAADGSAETVPVPVILTAFDSYQGTMNTVDLAIDVDPVFPEVCRMAWCHQSQICEWLPWVAAPERITPPKDEADWEAQQRRRAAARNRSLGLSDDRPRERFSVTAWGRVPTLTDLQRDLPGLDARACDLAALERRLKAWRGG